MSTIAPSGFECEREPGDFAAVDDIADFEHDIIVGCREVKVGRESAVVAEATLPKAGTAFEDEPFVVEHPGLVEEEQKVILGDVKERCGVCVAATQGVSADE